MFKVSGSIVALSKHVLVFIALACFLYPAFSSENISKNHFEKANNNSAEDSKFIVAGNDPYITFDTQYKSINDDSELFLNIDLGREVKNLELELFYHTKDEQFSPYFKVKFLVPSFPASLKLPAEVSSNLGSKLRLDLVSCTNCVVDFSSVPEITSTASNSQTIAAIKDANVVKALPQIGSKLTLNDWLINHIDGDITKFNISGEDPFIVSPLFSINTDGFAGVFIHLTAPTSDAAYNDYQLLYQTERHGFSSTARSTFRIANKNTNSVEFFIPLPFLSQELPKDHILKRIRLDIPLINGSWSLTEATVSYTHRRCRRSTLCRSRWSPYH